MKSKIVSFLLFFSPSMIFAMFVGNPSFPALLEEGIVFTENPVNLRIGYDLTSLVDEKLHIYRSEEENVLSFRIPSRMQTFSLILNIKERVDLGIFSGQYLLFPCFQKEQSLYELKSSPSYFVAGGGKVLFVENHNFSFGIDGKYLFFRTHIAALYKNSIPQPGTKSMLQIKEWQIAPAISYNTGFLVPYFGIPCRFTKMQIHHVPFMIHRILRFKSLHKAGICLGTTICSPLGIFLNVEGRWLVENGYTFSSEIRF